MKIFLYLGIILCGVVFAAGVRASESIDKFDVRLTINEDGSMGFNSVVFANSISSIASSANKTLASSPSSGGAGGSSGGGFGGGGRGSW